MTSEEHKFKQRKCRECGSPMKHVGKHRHPNGHSSHKYECRNKGCDKRGKEVIVG